MQLDTQALTADHPQIRARDTLHVTLEIRCRVRPHRDENAPEALGKQDAIGTPRSARESRERNIGPELSAYRCFCERDAETAAPDRESGGDVSAGNRARKRIVCTPVFRGLHPRHGIADLAKSREIL